MSEKGKRAFITGINGQDGSYLTELLIDKGYEVWGILRRNSLPENQTTRLGNVGLYPHPRLHLIYGDMLDMGSLCTALKESQPDEVYNLAAQSHVRISFDQPQFTTNVVANGTLNLLEAVRLLAPEAKVYQAGSSEMFGNECDEDGFRRESTLMRPVSPYGCAKLYAHNLCRVYRSSYDMFVSNGILFNHESPRRGLNFVTNKVVEGAARIAKGLCPTLTLGNMEATRDWGHSKDYVYAMWLMLQQEAPDDFVVATGESKSVRQLCEYVFAYFDLDYRDHVVTDSKFYRPTELHDLRGDCTKAKKLLGWSPEYSFEKLLDEMIESRLKTL